MRTALIGHMNTNKTESNRVIRTTIGNERNGRGIYHDGQCLNCGKQFMSDWDSILLVNGYVKFCTKQICEMAAQAVANRP